MIITKKLEIKITKQNCEHYTKLGYNTNNKFIIIDVSDLTKGSNIEIEVKCDYCESIRLISYKEYNRNIEKNKKYSCSIKCGILKSKETNLLKYGVEHTFQLDKVKEKIKTTNFERYGVEHVSQIQNVKDIKKIKYDLDKYDISEKIKKSWNKKNLNDIQEINKKREETNITKYGVKNISQNNTIKEKKKITFEEKYSGFTYSSIELNEKVNTTLIEKYGTTNISSLPEIQNKIKNTNIEKYGFERPTQNELIKNKIKNTFKTLYDVDNIMFNEDFRKNNYKISNDELYVKYIGGRISEFKCDCDKNHNFEIDYYNYYQRKKRKCKLCTICYPISENVSIKEKELYRFIENNYKGKIIENYRDHFEIDIYLPNINIGFEFNGLYWHSDIFTEKDKHLNKLNYFKEKGIRIIYIWEDDWDLKNDIIKSQIKNWLNITENKIFARKCKIEEITDNKLIRTFLDNNHIQGSIHSNIKIGLFYLGELVSIMIFDKNEGRKKLNEDEWNLSRFCNKINTSVIGAASKLLTYFNKKYKCNRIISYSDKSWSNGNLYYKLGFKLISESKVNYKYIINNKRENKQKFTKKKLKDDMNKTEKEIMKERNIPRIYDCGQLKFEIKK